MDRRSGRVQQVLQAIGAWVKNAMRGAVRCVFPLFCLAVFALFVWAVPQGQDVLRGLVERAAGGAIAGTIWLGGAVVALSLSVWYAMRWLLTAAMPGLPLDDSPGLLRRWLPRLAGAVPAAVVALRWLWLDDLQADEREMARWLAVIFAATAVLLLLSFAGRGWLMQWLVRRGWIAPPHGREASASGALVPSQLGPDEPLPWVTQVIVGWTLMLSVLLTLLITRFPVGVPEDIGAAAIAGIALASICLSGSFLLTLWPLRRGVPHLAPWVLLLAGVFGAFNDNHVVRPSPLALPAAARPTLEQAFVRHLQARPAGARPAVIFVASEGGGIRAAFWTAQVLDELAREVPEWPARAFVLSGVSGGSLGLASWLAVERSRRCPQALYQDTAGLAWGGAGGESVRRRLGADFLTPPVAGMLFYNLIQHFWPWPVERFDRSRALEQAWQRAHSHLPGRPFERPLAQWYDGCEGLPELMLNTTVVETGQRAVLTRLDPGEAFINHFRGGGADDLMSPRYSAATQSAAGLVHHSARFPALSPAGTIERIGPPAAPALRLVDGGYFDNSGAQTVADLVETLCRTKDFRPIVLLVRNAQEPLNGRLAHEIAPSRLYPEVGSIVGALYNARGAHAVAARLALQGRLDADLIDVAVPVGTAAPGAPLGWALSSRAQGRYERAARQVAHEAGIRLRERLAAGSNGCERVRESAAKDAR